MGTCVCHVTVIVTLLISLFVSAKARTVSDVYESRTEKELFSGNTFYSSKGAMPYFLPRKPNDRGTEKYKKEKPPREPQLTLVTARGYGKRSSKTEMALLSARSYGKRNEEKSSNSFLCTITNCKKYSGILNIDEELISFLDRRNKDFPEGLKPDEDC